jgi:hypothetical protein
MVASTFNFQKEMYDTFVAKVLSIITTEGDSDDLLRSISSSALNNHFRLQILKSALDTMKSDLALKWNLAEPSKSNSHR